MSDEAKAVPPIAVEKPTGLALLRQPFPAHQISKLPKPTKQQSESQDRQSCRICGGWHHPKVIHLDYVGHAALTDRLLDADPAWYWEPMALADGLPKFDDAGGLWIKLYVCGQSRLGYGQAAPSNYKEIGSREKEVIGDALRNAAMRFGAALDLWHKGDLHLPDEPIGQNTVVEQPKAKNAAPPSTPTVESPAAETVGAAPEVVDHETGEILPIKDEDRKLTPGELMNIKKKMEAKKITEADIKMKWGVTLDELTKTDFKPITDWIKAAP